MAFVPTIAHTQDLRATPAPLLSEPDCHLQSGREAVIAAYQRGLQWLQRVKQEPEIAQRDAVRMFIEKLWAVDLLSDAHYQDLHENLDESYRGTVTFRAGREKPFHLQVYVSPEEGKSQVHRFGVMATNATDAYVALSKRSTYRALSDISLVKVFLGGEEDAEGAFPVRSFTADDLIFV